MSPMRKTHVSDKFVRIYGEKVGKLPERVQFGCSETHNARRGGGPAGVIGVGRRMGGGGRQAISTIAWEEERSVEALGLKAVVEQSYTPRLMDCAVRYAYRRHASDAWQLNSRECGLPDALAERNRPNLGVWCDHRDLCHFSFAWQKNRCYRDARSGRPLRGFSTRFWGAGMVKLVDTPDLGSGAARRGSSSLSTRTKKIAQSVAGSSLACRRMRPQRNEIA